MKYCPHCGKSLEHALEISPLEHAVLTLQKEIEDLKRQQNHVQSKLEDVYAYYLKTEENELQRDRRTNNKKDGSKK